MGIIFTVMLLPFVILDYPMGKLSDKIGEKKMLILSFTLTAIFVFMIPLIKNHSLFVWAGILFFTRVGAAIIEIMSESYFFKAVTVDNSEAISFFRNTGPMSYLIAPIIATIILATTPSFKYIFYILTPIMLLGTLISLRLKDIK
jgi:MFS family permease